jgi:hypothetical protein
LVPYDGIQQTRIRKLIQRKHKEEEFQLDNYMFNLGTFEPTFFFGSGATGLEVVEASVDPIPGPLGATGLEGEGMARASETSAVEAESALCLFMASSAEFGAVEDHQALHWWTPSLCSSLDSDGSEVGFPPFLPPSPWLGPRGSPRRPLHLKHMRHHHLGHGHRLHRPPLRYQLAQRTRDYCFRAAGA